MARTCTGYYRYDEIEMRNIIMDACLLQSEIFANPNLWRNKYFFPVLKKIFDENHNREGKSDRGLVQLVVVLNDYLHLLPHLDRMTFCTTYRRALPQHYSIFFDSARSIEYPLEETRQYIKYLQEVGQDICMLEHIIFNAPHVAKYRLPRHVIKLKEIMRAPLHPKTAFFKVLAVLEDALTDIHTTATVSRGIFTQRAYMRYLQMALDNVLLIPAQFEDDNFPSNNYGNISISRFNLETTLRPFDYHHYMQAKVNNAIHRFETYIEVRAAVTAPEFTPRLFGLGKYGYSKRQKSDAARAFIGFLSSLSSDAPPAYTADDSPGDTPLRVCDNLPALTSGTLGELFRECFVESGLQNYYEQRWLTATQRSQPQPTPPSYADAAGSVCAAVTPALAPPANAPSSSSSAVAVAPGELSPPSYTLR